jgi:hypothetical protein
LPVRAFISIEIHAESGNQSPQEIHMKPHAGFWSGGASFFDITIPNSVTTIGDGAFSGCRNLTSVTIPNSVTAISEGAFYHCGYLTAIDVDATNAQYSSENGVLFNKDKITLIYYPSGKTGSYVIPNSVTTINYDAFAGCSGLTSVTIPNSVKTIGNDAFAGCSGLTSVIIPNSVKTIGQYAFQSCSGLTTVIIPNSVTTIGVAAFYGCSGLTSVTIPNSVITIGQYAFESCVDLTTVTNLNPVPQNISSGVFYSVNISALTLKVPASAVNTYKVAPVWKDFGSIIANE